MPHDIAPTVIEVLSFEDLPLGALASRRAVVRWSDGSVGEALRWYGDEVLISEGDHGNSRLMSSQVEMPDSLGRSTRGGAHKHDEWPIARAARQHRWR